MEFVLFEKLAKLNGLELLMLIAAAVVAVAIIVLLCVRARRKAVSAGAAEAAQPQDRVRAMVYGALCVSLSFMLSYIKLFSMPLGGSITLCSMLPLAVYGYWYGPAKGFTAAFAYAILQVIQGAWIVHWAQFILDYFVAFTCLGLASLFPKRLPLGMAVAGLSRMVCSIVSGVVFFASSAAEAGYGSVIGYSLMYNGSTVGADTIICVIVALLPPVARMFEKLRPAGALKAG